MRSFINRIDRTLKKPNGIYKVYTVDFMLLCVLCFGFYIFSGKTFIWNSDGWNQHYKALIYYSKYLRGILRTLVTEFRIVIPQWDLNIGEGSDIIQTLHYYVIGDPFSFLCFLIPVQYMHIYFDLAVILRIYTAGLAFIALLRYEGINNGYAILAGVINYCFCQYVFCCMTFHPYFLNPMLFFPLMILGVEKILYERKYTCLTLSVAMAALSNFYFFYVYAILTAVFVLVRMCTFGFGKNPDRFLFLLRVTCSAVFGVLMGAVLFLPVLSGFANDSRLGTDNSYHLFYPLEYYLTLPKILTSSSNSVYELFFGVSAVAVVAAAYTAVRFFGRHKDKNAVPFYKKTIPCLAMIGCLFVVFPFFGQLMNGLTYRCNRWSFALVLLVSYIVSREWTNIMGLGRREGLIISLVLLIYPVLCFALEQSRDIYAIMEAAISLALVAFLLCEETEKKQMVCLGFVILSVVVSSHSRFSDSGSAACETREGINYRLGTNEAAAVRMAAQEDNVTEPYRYSAFSPTVNAGMLEKVSSTNFFFSNANPCHVNYEKYMGVSNDMDFYHIDYNERDTLLEMASVRYFATQYDEMAPYNYSLKTSFTDWKGENWNIYENAFPLSLTYSYPLGHGRIDKGIWSGYTETQRQEAMLKYALSDMDLGETEAWEGDPEPVGNVRETGYSVTEDNDGILVDGNRFYVLKDNAVLTIRTDSQKDSLLYMNIEGLDQKKLYDYDLYHKYNDIRAALDMGSDEWNEKSLHERMEMIRDKYVDDDSGRGSALLVSSDTGKGRTVACANPDSSWYSGRDNYAIDLGYTEDDDVNIYLRFLSKGIYTIEDIRVYNIDRSDYEADILKLSEVKLNDLNMDVDTISGKIKCDDDRLLCLSIPFLKGWSAYIDGEKTEVLNTNVLYMGLEVPKGEHTILLRYNTPFLKTGAVISVVSWLLFGLYCYRSKKQMEES